MKKILLTISLAIAANQAIAANISLDHYKSAVINLHPQQTKTNKFSASNEPVIKKVIMLPEFKLSATAQRVLAKNAEIQATAVNKPISFSASNALPNKFDNGMNGVPVLDQGMHGTCVTFAATGALDAAYGKGDYISQLCNLELGSYLNEQDPNYLDGWNGTFSKYVFAQIEQYGIISKRFQQSEGCAGVYEYPTYSNSTGKPYSADEFTRHSEKISATIPAKSILSIDDAMSDGLNMETILQNTKQSLANGHRVVIGTLLDDRRGEMGAEGRYHFPYDSWIITPEIIQDAKEHKIRAGHAIIIFGYDDDAVIKGPNGEEHKGVLIIRNSWTELAGDYGNYYMSYAYFKTFVMEAVEV